jgi:hypothetical protein
VNSVHSTSFRLLVVLILNVTMHYGQGFGQSVRPDIRKLSQHFLEPNEKTAPWSFVPQENIASLSTSEHPGVVTIWWGSHRISRR